MTRSEAFAEAEKIVERIAPKTNARGYLDGSLSPAARISEILRVAEWLLGTESEDQ